MKKFGSVLLSVLLCCFGSAATAYAVSAPYIVIGENLWLCDEATGKNLFLLPETYYAEVVGIDDDFYTIRFNGVKGKVSKSAVSVVGYDGDVRGTSQALTVSSKYSSFTAIKMRASPDDKEETFSIPVGETFSYLGSYPYAEQVWYYVAYGENYGYILSSFCDRLVTVEPFEAQTKEKVEVEEKVPEIGEEAPDYVKIIIIGGISLLVVVILLILFIPRRGRRKNRYYYEN